MPSYCILADVQANVPKTLWSGGPASSPSEAQVIQWIAATSAWIDSTLRWRYVTPVTDATDLLVLQRICGLLVGGQVWDAMFGTGTSAQQPANGASLRNTALRMLAFSEREGRSHVTLPGTPLATDGEAAIGQPEGSFTDPDTAGDVPRLFKIDMQF